MPRRPKQVRRSWSSSVLTARPAWIGEEARRTGTERTQRPTRARRLAAETDPPFEIVHEGDVPPSSPDLSIVVAVRNMRDALAQCIEALFTAGRGKSFEIVVVDDGSTDGSTDDLPWERPRVRLLRTPLDLGTAFALHSGIAETSGHRVLIVDPRAIVSTETIEALSRWLDEHADCGLVGAPVVDEGGRPGPSPRRVPTRGALLWDDSLLSRIWPGGPWCFVRRAAPGSDVGSPPYGALLVRREVVNDLGSFDSQLGCDYHEADWCQRIRQAGWKVQLGDVPPVVQLDTGPESVETILLRQRDRVRFARKHFGSTGVRLATLALYSWAPCASLGALFDGRVPWSERWARAGEILRGASWTRASA